MDKKQIKFLLNRSIYSTPESFTVLQYAHHPATLSCRETFYLYYYKDIKKPFLYASNTSLNVRLNKIRKIEEKLKVKNGLEIMGEKVGTLYNKHAICILPNWWGENKLRHTLLTILLRKNNSSRYFYNENLKKARDLFLSGYTRIKCNKKFSNFVQVFETLDDPRLIVKK